MRRSTRPQKQREFYRPTTEAIPELNSSDESDVEDQAMAPPRGKPTKLHAQGMVATGNLRSRASIGTVKTASTSKRKPPGKDNFTYDGPRCKLFDAMISGANVAAEVRAIVSLFETNHIAAIAELINFVLLAGGARKKWIENRVELEGLEPEELDELLRDMVSSMTAAEGYTVTPLYAPPNKKGVSIRESYFTVWAEFVDNVNSPLSQGFNLGTSDTTNPAIEILDMFIGVLVALSSSGLATIRDAVTEAALDIGQAILSLIITYRGKRDIATRQLKAEDHKSKSSKMTPKYKTLEKQVSEHEEVCVCFT